MEESSNTENKTTKLGPKGTITLVIAVIGCLLSIFNVIFDTYIKFDNKKSNSLEYQYTMEVRQYSGDIQSIINISYRKILLASQDTTFVLNITKEMEQLREIQINHPKHFERIVKFAEEKRQVEFATRLLLLINNYKTYTLDVLLNHISSLKEIVENPIFQERACNFKLGKNQLVQNNEGIKKDSMLAKNEASLIIQDTIAYYSSLDSFKPFVDYLVTKKNINNPDILFFYGIMENDLNCVVQAIDLGANLDITDVELVSKYSAEYEEYYIKHYNDKENYIIEPNEFVEEKRERFFDWNSFIKITNVIQLIAVLLLVVIVILYINNIKKKLESFSISSAENLYKLQMKLEEEAEHQHKTQEEFRDLKTTLVKYIENSFDEIWTMEKKESKTEKELINDAKVTSEDFSVPKIKSSLSFDLSKNESIKCYVLYYSKEGLQTHKTESKDCSVLTRLIEELDKKTELIKVETGKSKQKDFVTKEKLLGFYYDIKILFNEWLQNYLEDREVKKRFVDEEALSFINEYHKSGIGCNLHEDTIKRKHMAACVSYLLKKEFDYYNDDSQLKFRSLSERIKDCIKRYDYLKDIQIVYEKVKNMTYQFGMKYNDSVLNTQYEELLQNLSINKNEETSPCFGEDTMLYLNKFYKQIEEISFTRQADSMELEKSNIKDYNDGNDSFQKEDFVKFKYQLLLQDLLEKDMDYGLDDLWKEIQEIIEKIKDQIKSDKYLENIRILYEKINALTDPSTDNTNSLEKSKIDENFEEIR